MDEVTKAIVIGEGLKAEMKAFLKFSRGEDGQPNVTPRQREVIDGLLEEIDEPELCMRDLARIRTEFEEVTSNR